MNLDYATPTPAGPRRQPWSVSFRLFMGVVLTLPCTFACAILADAIGPRWDEAAVLPMGFVAEWVHNRNTTTNDIFLSNGIFWGFLIAFVVRRRWSWKLKIADFVADKPNARR